MTKPLVINGHLCVMRIKRGLWFVYVWETTILIGLKVVAYSFTMCQTKCRCTNVLSLFCLLRIGETESKSTTDNIENIYYLHVDTDVWQLLPQCGWLLLRLLFIFLTCSLCIHLSSLVLCCDFAETVCVYRSSSKHRTLSIRFVRAWFRNQDIQFFSFPIYIYILFDTV